MLRLLPVFLAVAVWVYALVDCVRTPEEEMPYRMPKVVWIILVVVFPFVGAVAWIIVSRVARSQNGGGSGVWSSGPSGPGGRPGAPSGPVAPDDDPEFLFRLEQRRRREAAAERRRQAQRGEGGTEESAEDGGTQGRTGGSGTPGDDGEPGEGSPGTGGSSSPDVDSPR